ncbi:hypothetical protein FOQG_18139 [Fusarium oxysporum f. sp. raphani 54005]|uniref:Uncharacterized protein n=1 Tax=Fusarium oxysporum f. sp. raphani 54005 TaxID=1089458 RepID=X0B4T7_FUSOX|nr:hypothetical protein FOQG_18139 [Fusarium oxysporum f. sp. raphani 54005]
MTSSWAEMISLQGCRVYYSKKGAEKSLWLALGVSAKRRLLYDSPTGPRRRSKTTLCSGCQR